MKIKRIHLHTPSKFYNLNVEKIFRLLTWTGCIFCYFFQFPLKNISKFITPFLLLFFISEIRNFSIIRKKDYLCVLSILFIYLGFSCFNALFHNTDLSRVLRFLIILSLIILSLFIRDDDFEKEVSILVFLAVIKSLLLIAIALYLVRIGSHVKIRNWIGELGLGDIFLANRWRPKVQVQGNGILPLVLMLYTLKLKRQKKLLNIVSIILGGGILAAGNFAFILGIGIYFCYGVCKFLLSKKNLKGYYTPLIFFLLICTSPFLYKYLDKTIQQKSVHSNAIRLEQAQFLLETNYFIGKGLGHPLNGQGRFRVYGASNYYELQTLYIYHQIGAVGILLFYIVLLFYFYFLDKRSKDSKQRLLYFLIYLFYTFWNPYCFDTTEIITIISLLNIYIPPKNTKQREIQC